jgi:hypothetical protein
MASEMAIRIGGNWGVRGAAIFLSVDGFSGFFLGEVLTDGTLDRACFRLPPLTLMEPLDDDDDSEELIAFGAMTPGGGVEWTSCSHGFMRTPSLC